MKLYANDTLHVSSVGPDNLAPGEQFEVSDDVGQSLIDRGLASKVGASASPLAEKAERPQLNKMDVAPANKAAPKRKAK